MAHRVAYVIGELDKGGAEYQLSELVRNLDRTRFLPEVFVLAADGYWVAPLREMGVRVHTVPRRGSADVGRLLRLRRAVRAFDPTILHTVLWSANVYGRVAALGLGVPVVIAAERNVIRRTGWQRALERMLDRTTSHLLVNSAAISAELVDRGGLSADKITVIHNGVDLSRMPPFALDRRLARVALGFDPDRRLVAQVGRLTTQKDYPTFLAAAARVAAQAPDVDFLVVGTGEDRAALEAQAAAAGIGARVRFLGLRNDVPAILAAVDVMALTSLYEGLANVAIEAMANGAVAVITDVGGARELITDGVEGWIVPVRAPEVVADRILAMLADPTRARTMAQAARNRVEAQVAIGAMTAKTCAVYDRLIAQARG